MSENKQQAEKQSLTQAFRRVYDIAKAVDLDIDLSLNKYFRALKLLKPISIAAQIDVKVLAESMIKSPVNFLAIIQSVMLEEFDEETEKHGALSIKILNLFADILKTDRAIQEFQILELFEILNNMALKIEEKFGEGFLSNPGTIQPGNQEKSSTTETVSEMKQKKEKKN